MVRVAGYAEFVARSNIFGDYKKSATPIMTSGPVWPVSQGLFLRFNYFFLHVHQLRLHNNPIITIFWGYKHVCESILV